MLEIEILKWVIGGAHLPDGAVNESRLAWLLIRLCSMMTMIVAMWLGT